MRKALIIPLLLLFVISADAQRHNAEKPDHTDFIRGYKHRSDCDSRVLRTDSTVMFAFNSTTGEYSPTQVTIYGYDTRENLTEILVKRLPERENIIRQIFEYDDNNKQIRYTNYPWINGAWEMTLYVDKTYDPDGRIVTEIFHNKDPNGHFRAYMRHFYSHSNDRIDTYLRQMRNGEGNWYDFSRHYYNYDSNGRLALLYGQYINGGPVYWERTSIFEGDSPLVRERFLRQLKYNPVARQNELTNTSHQVFSYNIYEYTEEIKYYDWTGNEWIYAGKGVAYHSYLEGKKVSLCLNGVNLCVSVNAVKALLETGATIGFCEGPEWERPGNNRPNAKQEILFDIYPNPARNQITIRFNEKENPYTHGILLSADGRVLAQFHPQSTNQLRHNVASLINGTYYVKMYKPDGSADTRPLIKK